MLYPARENYADSEPVNIQYKVMNRVYTTLYPVLSEGHCPPSFQKSFNLITISPDIRSARWTLPLYRHIGPHQIPRPITGSPTRRSHV